MKKILIVLGLFITLAANAQFTSWDEPSDPLPTTQELLATLSSGQRSAILLGFAEGKAISEVKYLANVQTAVVSYFYAYLRQINTCTDELMIENNYNASQLIAAVYAEFSADFTQAQIQAVLTKKVEWSDGVGNADWDYYKDKITQ